MRTLSWPTLAVACMCCLVNGVTTVWAQQEIGFIEKFATASDRKSVLADLVPGTEDYFYYHCLHYQNEAQLAASQAIIDQWKAKFGDNSVVQNMVARQMLLTYAGNSEATLNYLRDRLGLQFEHGAPTRDRAATLSSQLDPKLLDPKRLIDSAIARDRSLSQLTPASLPGLVGRTLAADQWRAWLQRIDRSDIDGLVKIIANELAMPDSQGFGWAQVHRLLTLEQLDELLKLRPVLAGQDVFVLEYATRLFPPQGSSMDDPKVFRDYLERMLAFARRLPDSQNNFKAMVLGNLLRLNLREEKFDRKLFLEYLALPRQAHYYAADILKRPTTPLVDLSFSKLPQIVLPPVGDDSSLIVRYLEHFLQTENRLDDFAKYLDRGYLERVQAETKILYGSEDKATWYAKLSPGDQKALRERVELRFGPKNELFYSGDKEVSLDLELKNVSQLLIRIYEVNPRNHFRTLNKPVGTDIDLDGLVPNHQKSLDYTQPAERRHSVRLPLPELNHRGVWVVDFVGNGQRLRALIQKGTLTSLVRMSDAGHVVQIVDEKGTVVKKSHIELADQSFPSDDQGQVVIPFVEQARMQEVLLVTDELAVVDNLMLSPESYQLRAGFVIDRQSLIAGAQAQLLIRARLECNGRPVSLKLLEGAQLTLTATDLDNISTAQTTEVQLNDSQELVHRFLVPQRLHNLQIVIQGKVRKQSRDAKQEVQVSESLECNGQLRSDIVGAFYLRPAQDGYRISALGRNGEPLKRLPVNLSFTTLDVQFSESATLATDEKGELNLGMLPRVTSIALNAEGVQSSTIDLNESFRAWPPSVHLSTEDQLQLPLGQQSVEPRDFSLTEIRRQVVYRDLSSKIQLKSGRLQLPALEPGEYRLMDREAGQVVAIHVVQAENRLVNHLVSKTSVLDTLVRQPIVIEQAEIAAGHVQARISGHDNQTQIYILAHPFFPTLRAGARVRMPYPPLQKRSRQMQRSYYLESLDLDEEYSYILQRQQLTKYPGNLLPQPGLLIHPWEISLTDNMNRDAKAGAAMPNVANPAPAAPPSAAAPESKFKAAASTVIGYDFLKQGTIVRALPASALEKDGTLSLELASLEGYAMVEIVAVHPTSTDARRVFLPRTDLQVRDLRLKSAFPSDKHLAEMQTVRILKANEQQLVGDARTSRVQLYTTLADVYRLYGTLLQNSEWEKFRFVTQWPSLDDREKRAKYSEMSCHELDFFLFHKDRKFFDAVVAPFIEQKMDKQLMDLWLLDRSLESYRSLWRIQKLNTLERVLMSLKDQSMQESTRRWLDESLIARPLPVDQRMARFEWAMRGTSLDLAVSEKGAATALAAGLPGAMAESHRFGKNFALQDFETATDKREKQMLREEKRNLGVEVDAKQLDFYSIEREVLGRKSGEIQLFQSLDQTRQWAETHYYHVRLSQQVSELIPANRFWQELLAAPREQKFLSQNLDLPVSNINEALCALAVIDLPFENPASDMVVENDRLMVKVADDAIAYIQSIEPAEPIKEVGSILVGQDIYLSQPHTDQEADRPIQDQPLLIGTPYKAKIVVTNPTSQTQRVQVLCQLPVGSLPLGGSKVTRATPLELSPYSTSQVEYKFYFPGPGKFEHYGTQVNRDRQHIAARPSSELRVLAEPETVDQTTWSYIADWGTSEQVLSFLKSANLQRLDLSRIAFRMKDKVFYAQVIELLTKGQRFDPILWAYAVRHNDVERISELLQNRADFVSLVGPVLHSPLLKVEPTEQMTYEHMEYKPLVVARSHLLGTRRMVLNDSLFKQYNSLLNILAHQPKALDSQKMEMCYYMLLQNRLEEAFKWFESVEADQLATSLQYDYFDAYLDFYRGKYDRASDIAKKYVSYPVPRWQELFAQVSAQINERTRLLSGESSPSDQARSGFENADQLLTGQREASQSGRASKVPTLDLSIADGTARVEYRNIESLQVNYYLMDIELLFSRNPFVARSGDRLPSIRPNYSETLQLTGAANGSRVLDLPESVRNRNVLVEVTAAGLSRSSVLTANTLSVTLAESLGRIQVQNATDKRPVEAAYVKVYARHKDGSVKFFKDGYTDLRGQFDYASLSTADLNSTERLSILVIDPRHGAIVREAAPPTR